MQELLATLIWEICIPNLQPIRKIVKKISVRKCQIAMIPRDSLGPEA